MGYATQVKSISTLKANAAELLQELTELRRPLVITQNGRADRMVREYGAPTIREVLLGNYRIIYRLEATRVLVLKFLEGHKPALRR